MQHRYNGGMSWTAQLAERFEKLIAQRYFRFAFWVTAAAVIVFSMTTVLSGTLETLELSLLDVRLRWRALETAPSEDIVIVAIDNFTDNYIRQHPEIGLYDPVLPRDKMARVLAYLNRQQVRAVVFDLEFKKPDPDGDPQLARAIRENGHVYSAARMADEFEWYYQRNVEDLMILPPRERQVLIAYISLIGPYLERTIPWQAPLLGRAYLGPLDLGLGPFYAVSPLAGLDTIIGFYNRQASLVGPTTPLPSGLVGARPPLRQVRQDVLASVFMEQCTRDNYETIYRNDAGFLGTLRQMRLPLKLRDGLRESIMREMTRCYTYPVSPELRNAVAGLGVPTVIYDSNGYVRSVPLLHRGYLGNFYTYLGFQPALALLGVESLAYSDRAGTLQMGQRALPLYQGQYLFVNWRNPQKLAESMLLKAGLLSPRPAWYPYFGFVPELMQALRGQPPTPYEKLLHGVSADKNNTLLGGGNLYRSFHIIDILRLAQGETLSGQELGPLYQVPGQPQTGLFSFKDKIVVIGDTIKDVHRSPVSNTMHGPEIVANVLDMALHDRTFVRQAPALWQWGIIALLLLAISAAVVRFEQFSIGFTVGLVLLLLYWVFNFIVFKFQGLWFELVTPTGVLGLTLLASTLYRYYIHDQEKHQLTGVFASYVSPQVLNEIVKNPAQAMENLKGGKKELTVLFADLQGFTQQFEHADPERMVQQLNEYFDAMTGIILANGGTYDKYMGDAVMAFFGAPAELPNHAEMACRAAVEMHRALYRLNAQWEAGGLKTLRHGIGISSGEMFVGNFGSKNIKNFTVMGNNVNLGARLEAYTRVADWPIIISARTRELAGDTLQVRDLGDIRVKGFSEAVQCYGLEAVRVPGQNRFQGWWDESPATPGG